MDDWEDLRFLVACLDATSLSEAAIALGVRQSTVSRRIAGLEAKLGAPLFHRTADGIVPTDMARSLEADARAAAEHMKAFGRRAAGLEEQATGLVRVAATDTLALHLLVPALDALAEKHPGIVVEFVTSEATSDLVRGEADLALRFVRPDRGDLVAKRVASMAMGVLASRRYVQRHGVPRLDGGRWLRYRLPWMVAPEQRWFDTHVVVPPFFSTTSYELGSQAVLDGVVCGLLSADLAAARPGEVAVYDVGVPVPPPLELWLVTHRSLRLLPRVAAVWDFLAAMTIARQREILGHSE